MNRLLIPALALLLVGPAAAQEAVTGASVSLSTGAVKVQVSTPPNDVSAGPTGFTGAGTLAVASTGSGSVGIQLTGTFTGLAATFQATVDNSNWFTVGCTTTGIIGNVVTGPTSATAVGSWTCPAAGYQQVRVNVTAVSTGTATFTLNASAGSAQPFPNDPCTNNAKTNGAFGTSGATNVQVVAPVSGKKIYLCSISIIAGAAAHFNVIEGTGGACTTANEAAVYGSTTAASGMSLAANGGWTVGSGNGTIGQTATAANGICVLTDSSVQFGGNMMYVQQ